MAPLPLPDRLAIPLAARATREEIARQLLPIRLANQPVAVRMEDRRGRLQGNDVSRGMGGAQTLGPRGALQPDPIGGCQTDAPWGGGPSACWNGGGPNPLGRRGLDPRENSDPKSG